MGEDTQRRRLPVWRTTKSSFLILFFNRRLALKLALIPVGLDVAVIAISEVLNINWYTSEAYIGLALLSTAIAIPAITAWHRLVVLGHDHPLANLNYRFRKTEWSYLWRYIVYSAVMVLIPLAVGGLTALVALVFDERIFIMFAVAFVLVFAILQRFSLIFPAAAVGVNLCLKDSWFATRGNIWRLPAAVAAVGLPFGLLKYGIYNIWVTILPDDVRVGEVEDIFYLLDLIDILIWYFWMMAMTSVWSWAYRYLVEGEDIVLPGERA